jgi:hypothetical protein
MDYYKEVAISRSDILPLVYFIISMFQREKNHRQGISEKSDLIGGYIDRWINKLSENIIFNKVLLENKDYKVVNDYFIYGNDKNSRADKNAPDILGLKTNNGDIIRFAEFNNKTWIKCSNMPYIEVKTYKTNQKLIVIRETQLQDDNFYVLVESNFAPDYLISLFADDVFDDSFLNLLKMDSSFIKNNEHGMISQTRKINCLNYDNLGTLKLLAVMKGEDIRTNAIKVNSKENICYFKDVEEVSEVRRPDTDVTLKDFFKNERNTYNDKKIIPFEADKPDKIIIKSTLKTCMYIEVLDDCCIYDVNLSKGKTYKILIEEFRRSSTASEYVMLKRKLRNKLDKTEELISILDDIAYKKQCSE